MSTVELKLSFNNGVLFILLYTFLRKMDLENSRKTVSIFDIWRFLIWNQNVSVFDVTRAKDCNNIWFHTGR